LSVGINALIKNRQEAIMSRRLLLLFLAFSLCGFYALAGSLDDFRIARVSYLNGHVSFQHTDEVDWTAASINMPLQPGDRIYTGDNGRAEIEFDDGSVLRLAEKADVEILTMKDQLIQLRVSLGLCSLINRSGVPFEIDTPAAAFTTTEKGSFRFDIAENGDSDGIVRKGEMEATNNSFSRRVQAGEVLHVASAENSSEILARYDQRDAWDDWNDRRNADATASASTRYLPDYVSMGVASLDQYGSWLTVDQYGSAWVPMVNASWSPYSSGRWIYRDFWGWTWVSDESFGWLPYHYGRWYYANNIGWCWIPGASFGFHFWSPGLVRFYEGADWVSWYALGPGDYYDVNNLFFNNQNRANLFYLNELRLMQKRGPNDLVNHGSPGAFRSVRTDQFVNGNLGPRVEPVRGLTDPSRAGRLVTGSLDVHPTARSFGQVPDQTAVRPTVKQRAVVVRNEPVNTPHNERFVHITNPQYAAPRAVGAAPVNAGQRQPTRDMRSNQNSIGRNTEVMPNRNATQSNQTAPYRSGSQTGNNAQQAAPRTQQPPAGAAGASSSGTRRMEVTPPRSAPSAPPSMSAPSRPSVQSSAPPSMSASPSMDRPAATAAPPANSSAPPSNAPVKKAPTW